MGVFQRGVEADCVKSYQTQSLSFGWFRRRSWDEKFVQGLLLLESRRVDLIC